MSPADELRAASQKIRDIAAAATPGPWTEFGLHAIGVEQLGYDDGHMVCEMQRCEDHQDRRLADAEHVALWHPGVAELVAQLLEKEASLGNTGLALDLARAINQGSKP